MSLAPSPQLRALACARQPRGQRALGVVYQPQYESFGNYVPTVLPRRYDALLYVDKSHALSPLHMPERTEADPPRAMGRARR